MLTQPFETHVPSSFLPLLLSRSSSHISVSSNRNKAHKTEQSFAPSWLSQSPEKDKPRSPAQDIQRHLAGDYAVSRETRKIRQNEDLQGGSVGKAACHQV